MKKGMPHKKSGYIFSRYIDAVSMRNEILVASIVLAVLVAAAFFLPACDSAEVQAPWSNIDVHSDTNKTINIKTGEKFIIKYETSGTLFPIFEETVDTNIITLIEKKHGLIQEKSPYNETSWYLFEASGAGNTTITLKQFDHLTKPLIDQKTFSVSIESRRNDVASSVTSRDDELDGSQWKLISLNDEPLIPGSYISLYFMQGKFWGYLGLNTYDGNYLVESPGVLGIFEFCRTLVGGSENIIQQENNFLTYLRDSSGYKITDNHLEFYDDAGKRSLVLEKLPEHSMNPADLIGTQWELVSQDGEAASTGLCGILKFESDTKAIGEAGSFLAELDYQACGDNLYIRGSSGKNRMDISLPRDLERQASQYTSSLSFAASFRLSQDQLQIFTVRGNTLVFKPLTGASSSGVKIPNCSPVIYEKLDYIMRGQFNYLYIFGDGSLIYVEEKGLRMPSIEHPPIRIWRTGKLQIEELGTLLDYFENNGFDELGDYSQFGGKPIEGGPTGGFAMGDMGLTITFNNGNLSKTVSAFGYLTPDHGETYPDMPSPLNELYGKLRAIAQATDEVAHENISQ